LGNRKPKKVGVFSEGTSHWNSSDERGGGHSEPSKGASAAWGGGYLATR
jgi:hypothetical protein